MHSNHLLPLLLAAFERLDFTTASSAIGPPYGQEKCEYLQCTGHGFASYVRTTGSKETPSGLSTADSPADIHNEGSMKAFKERMEALKMAFAPAQASPLKPV